MTTGRINQVAFLDDAVSARAGRPTGQPARDGDDGRSLVSDERVLGQERGRETTSMPFKLSASESSSKTSGHRDNASVPWVAEQATMFVLRHTARENARRTRDVGTNECRRVGTQHKKLETRPRLSHRAWTVIEEECRGGRRCPEQGSNQP